METSGKAELAAANVKTPVGLLRVWASPRGICRIDLRARGGGEAPGSPAARRHLARALKQLREYFAGRRTRFDLALDLQGTEHQLRVWKALLDIPFGRTQTYGEVARHLDLPPEAARAVGRACATNPVPLVVPCHRVIGGDGGLHGFGGGLWMKRALLELEGSDALRQLTLFGPRKSRGT